MRSFAFALLAATVFATPALAQDTAPFTGARVEGIIGWDQLRNNGKDDGVLYGIGAGYDVQMGSMLVGGDVEFSDSTVKQRAYDVFAAGDLALAEAARLLYALPERPGPAALVALAEPWRPWRAVAARALWAYYRVAEGREGVR